MWRFCHSDEDTGSQKVMFKPVYNQKITPGCWCTSHKDRKPTNQLLQQRILKLAHTLNNSKHPVSSSYSTCMCFTEHVFALDATDEFLTKRAQGLPQSVAEKMRYTQEEFIARLTSYRQLSTAEETLLDYFDELEIHPEHIGTVLKDASKFKGYWKMDKWQDVTWILKKL